MAKLNAEDLADFREKWLALKGSETAHNMMSEGFSTWSATLRKKYRIKKDDPFLVDLQTGEINANGR